MEIGLYFGSFNPIHNGHCIIASHIAQHTNLERIWFVVSPQNPFKESASLLNEYHRLHLVKLAVEGDEVLKPSDIEFHLPRPSYTIDTMTYLKEKYPQHVFSIILGSDGLQNIQKWKNAPTLLKEYDIYVYRRPGFENLNIPGARIHYLQAPLLEISSTYIREIIRQGKSPRYLVPDKVAEEIIKYNYYK